MHIKLSCYSSAHADIWALGAILFNLVTGEYPWRKAKMSNEHFFYYIMHNRDYLASFAITEDLNDIFKSIFTASPRNRISLAELRLRIVTLKTFRMRPCISPDGSLSSLSSYGSVLSSSEVEQVVLTRKGKAVEKTRNANQALHLHELLAANLIHRRSDSADSVSFEALRENSVHSYNHISIGSQQWPSGLRPNAANDAPLLSAFLGGDDIESITCVEMIPAPTTPAREPLTVRNPSPPSYNDDSDSDYDSDEAITPETHAVDAATKGAGGDIPEFDLNQSNLKSTPAGPDTFETPLEPIVLSLPAAKLAFNGSGAASTPNGTGTDGTYSAAQNMLMVAARRMRMRRMKNLNLKLAIAAKA